MKKCYWGHSGDTIAEYGTTDCVKRCEVCGEHYFMLADGDNLFKKVIAVIFLIVLVGVIITEILGIS